MAREGYLSIRGLPLGDKSTREYLEQFFKKHDLCGKCKGLGYKVTKGYAYDDSSFSVPFKGIKPLEKLKAAEVNQAKFASKIRAVILMSMGARKNCKHCQGSGFTKK
jgi:hypothetical protein